MLSMLSGEKLSLYRGLGVVAALAGVILVAAGEKSRPQAIAGRDVENESAYAADQNDFAGIFWAVAAAVCFGFLFWLLGTRIIPRTGAIATVWLIRLTGTAITLCAVLARRIPLRVPNKRTRAQLYSMGFFDTAAFALSNLGMRIEQVAIVSVLGSLYGAITVALAAVFLGERIAALQWSGIAAIFIGIVFMNA
jgi:drug/metabolite transporter (DMT)-like permease